MVSNADVGLAGEIALIIDLEAMTMQPARRLECWWPPLGARGEPEQLGGAAIGGFRSEVPCGSLGSLIPIQLQTSQQGSGSPPAGHRGRLPTHEMWIHGSRSRTSEHITSSE